MTKRTWILSIGGIALALLGFVVWYQFHYSMKPAPSFEVSAAAAGPRVLIATQGSEFKNAVVAAVVEHLKQREAYVKVIDVSSLANVDVGAWNAIVVIHTWEMRKPPAAVKTFVDGMSDRSKLIVMTTSGRGDFKLEGVDALSAASRVEDAAGRAGEISARIDAVLNGHDSSTPPPDSAPPDSAG